MIKINRLFQCPYCNETEENPSQILVQDGHLGGQSWKCEPCGRIAVIIFSTKIEASLKKVDGQN